MKTRLVLIALLGSLAACANEAETRVAGACEAAFVDPPGERTTYDSIETICGCFAKDTRHNDGSNYLGRIEAALAAIAQRRAQDGTPWPDAYVALEADYTDEGDADRLEGLGDVLARMSGVEEDLKDGKCEGGLSAGY